MNEPKDPRAEMMAKDEAYMREDLAHLQPTIDRDLEQLSGLPRFPNPGEAFYVQRAPTEIISRVFAIDETLRRQNPLQWIVRDQQNRRYVVAAIPSYVAGPAFEVVQVLN